MNNSRFSVNPLIALGTGDERNRISSHGVLWSLGRSALAVILAVVLSMFFFLHAFAQSSDTAKSDIYSKLKCCRCDDPFDKCSCPEANEIKAYIDGLIESNTNKEDIFYKVSKKFSLNVILDNQIKNTIEKRIIAEAGKSRPQLTLESDSFDFGRVSRKQGKVSKVFKLLNKGGSSLIITSMKTTCPCASVSLKVGKNKSPFYGTEGSPKGWQVEIKPGRDAELELALDLASPHVKAGKLIREATVISNDPVYPEVTVQIEGEVVN